jgi:hypothetical protein
VGAFRSSQSALTPEQRLHRRHLRRTIVYPILVGESLLYGTGAAVGLVWGEQGAIAGALIAMTAATLLVPPAAFLIGTVRVYIKSTA